MDASVEKVADATLASLQAAAAAHFAALAVGHKSSMIVGRLIAMAMSRAPVDIDKIGKDSEATPEAARAFMTTGYNIVIGYLPSSSPFIEPLAKMRDEAVARITG
jgi:hypothetical protein